MTRLALPAGAPSGPVHVSDPYAADRAEGAALARRIVRTLRHHALDSAARVEARRYDGEADRAWQEAFVTTVRRLCGEPVRGVVVSGPQKGIQSVVVAKTLPDGSQTPRELAAALRAGHPARAAITGNGGRP